MERVSSIQGVCPDCGRPVRVTVLKGRIGLIVAHTRDERRMDGSHTGRQTPCRVKRTRSLDAVRGMRARLVGEVGRATAMLSEAVKALSAYEARIAEKNGTP